MRRVGNGGKSCLSVILTECALAYVTQFSIFVQIAQASAYIFRFLKNRRTFSAATVVAAVFTFLEILQQPCSRLITVRMKFVYSIVAAAAAAHTSSLATTALHLLQFAASIIFQLPSLSLARHPLCTSLTSCCYTSSLRFLSFSIAHCDRIHRARTPLFQVKASSKIIDFTKTVWTMLLKCLLGTTGSFVMLCQTLEAQNANKTNPWGQKRNMYMFYRQGHLFFCLQNEF